jgi:hypothetical protein
MGVFFCYALQTGRLAMSFQNGLSLSALSSRPKGNLALESYVPSILPNFETTTKLKLNLRA